MKSIIFFIIFISLFSTKIISQNIYPFSRGLTNNGQIRAIEYDSINDIIYIGGHFSGVDSLSANNIAYLKNGVWHKMGEGVSGYVYAIKCVNNKTYVGGYFKTAGGKIVNNIACWDGNQWTSLGNGAEGDGIVIGLEWHEGELYAAGTFKDMSGVKNNLCVKWDGQKWKSSGAELPYHTWGFEVIDQKLYVWGYTFPGIKDKYHTASYLENGKWHEIPVPSDMPDKYCISACVYKNELYMVNSANQLFKYENSKWNKINIQIPIGKLNNIFSLKGKFYGIFKDIRDSYITEISLEDFKAKIIISIFENNYDWTEVLAYENINDEIWVGGYFRHIDTLSNPFLFSPSIFTPSLFKWNNNTFASPGKIIGESYIDAWDNTTGNEIIKYYDDIIIGGEFLFADNVYANNIARFDGNKFYPMDDGIDEGILKFYLYKKNLLSYTYTRKLFRWNISNWESFAEGITGYRVRYRVINDELYAFGDHLSYNNNDILGVAKWDGDKWITLPAEWEDYYDDHIKALGEYNGKLVVLNDEVPKILNDDGSFTKLSGDTLRFENLFSIDNRLFGYDEFAHFVMFYEYKNNIWKQVILDSTERETIYGFIKMEDNLYCVVNNNGLYKETANGWEYISYIQPRSVVKLDDNKYLATGFFPGTRLNGYDDLTLNHLAILEFKEPEVSIEVENNTICPNEYAIFSLQTNALNLKYDWDFEGGIPEKSTIPKIFVKYPHPGTYNVTLKATNDEGTVIEKKEEIVRVKDNCQTFTPTDKNYDNIWISGYEYYGENLLGGFDFSNGYAYSTAFNSPFDISRTGTAISNKYGLLQFFTNGIQVANKYGQIMDGSEGFNDDNYFLEYSTPSFYNHQGVLVLPKSLEDDKYFLFHMSVHKFKIINKNMYLPIGLYYSIIDMKENEGEGKMILKKQIILDDTLHYSTMQAVPHCNNSDWWLIVGEYNSNNYYSVLIGTNGVKTFNKYIWNVEFDEKFYGQSVFSPDGSHFAIVNPDNSQIYLWEFDRCSGKLSNLIKLNYNPKDEYDKPEGCGFSPNSRFLYISSVFYLRQYDLCEGNIEGSEKLIGEWDGQYDWLNPVSFGRMRLGPDGRMYISSNSSGVYFSVIENPDEKGSASNFQQHSVAFPSVTNNDDNAISEYPHYRIGKPLSVLCDSLSNSTKDILQKFDFTIFPNPAKTKVDIIFEYTTDTKRTITIRNLQGMILSTQVMDEDQEIIFMSLDTFSPGMYLVTVEIDNKVILTKKLCVMN